MSRLLAKTGLLDTGQLGTGDSPTFASINTGQGANELYGMDQNVLTSSSPQFTAVKSATLKASGGTNAISIDSSGNVSFSNNVIKHTNGTTAITINTDGSLSGTFPAQGGAVKFKSKGKASGSPGSGKHFVCYAICFGANNIGVPGIGMGIYGTPVAIHDNSSWTYHDYHVSEWSYSNDLGSDSDDAETAAGAWAAGSAFVFTLLFDNA